MGRMTTWRFVQSNNTKYFRIVSHVFEDGCDLHDEGKLQSAMEPIDQALKRRINDAKCTIGGLHGGWDSRFSNHGTASGPLGPVDVGTS